MSKFKDIKLDNIRKVVPSLIALDLVSVQPMEPDFYTKLLQMKKLEGSEYKVGDRIHSFIYGYQRWDGKEFIDEQTYFEMKDKGLLKDQL